MGTRILQVANFYSRHSGGLRTTVAAVYMAKSRVTARLKELVRQVQGPDADRMGESHG